MGKKETSKYVTGAKSHGVLPYYFYFKGIHLSCLNVFSKETLNMLILWNYWGKKKKQVVMTLDFKDLPFGILSQHSDLIFPAT